MTFGEFIKAYLKPIPITYQFRASTWTFDSTANSTFNGLQALIDTMDTAATAYNTA